MTFFRPLKEIAPEIDPELSWPIDGLTYLIMFFGPFCGSVVVGMALPDTILGNIASFLVGCVVGTLVTVANVWLFDYKVVPWIARHQTWFQYTPVLVATNVLAFVWAIGVTAFAMSATVAIMTWVGISWTA